MSTPATASLHDYVPGNKVKLIEGGAAFFTVLLQLIHAAQYSIHLQTYIFEEDITGTAVADALQQAARRNVKVYLIADGYASQAVGKTFLQRLRAAGVHVRFFEPILKNRYFYFGRRLHHKVFVADNRVALVGGRNITDRYNDMPDQPAWLDFALLAEGPAVQLLCEICNKTWMGQSQKRTSVQCMPNTYGVASDGFHSLIRVRRNDWLRHRNEISGTYIEMLRRAKKEVTIFCSYFLPGRFMRRLLASAAKRGVVVKVVTAGPSDVPLSKYAERWQYDWLLRNNIQLYEYQPTVLHAKIAVCDSEWLTIGSYNINNISAYASIELNTDVYDTGFATAVQQQLAIIIQQHCLPITPDFHRRHKNIFRQFIRWISYETVRLLFYLFTFYYKPKKE
jgi:cardiolipin synthase A/B